jgi:hypothetical protein
MQGIRYEAMRLGAVPFTFLVVLEYMRKNIQNLIPYTLIPHTSKIFTPFTIYRFWRSELK